MKTGQLSIIAAISQNYAIGKNNELLWHIPADLRHFKETTMEHAVVMGRKTYDSLFIKPLPKRKNIVLTRDMDLKLEGCEMIYSVKEALGLYSQGEELFVIGGGDIYKQFMPYINTLYITWVYKNYEADIYFPEISSVEWSIVDQSEVFTDEKSGLQYAYFVYKRKA